MERKEERKRGKWCGILKNCSGRSRLFKRGGKFARIITKWCKQAIGTPLVIETKDHLTDAS
jgi:hypothetical protein